MKSFFCIGGLIVLGVLSSCEKTDECSHCKYGILDEEFKKNLSYYESLSREEWLQLPDSLKIPAYNAMLPSTKRSFWMDKLEELENLDLPSDEIVHIKKIRTFIDEHADVFDRGFAVNNGDLIRDFSKNWISEGEERFGWTRPAMYYMVASGEILTIDMFYHFQGGGQPYVDDNPWCNCSTKNDWCFGKKKCTGTNCWVQEDGCGFLLVYKCTGKCL